MDVVHSINEYLYLNKDLVNAPPHVSHAMRLGYYCGFSLVISHVIFSYTGMQVKHLQILFEDNDSIKLSIGFKILSLSENPSSQSRKSISTYEVATYDSSRSNISATDRIKSTPYSWILKRGYNLPFWHIPPSSKCLHYTWVPRRADPLLEYQRVLELPTSTLWIGYFNPLRHIGFGINSLYLFLLMDHLYQ